MRTEKRVRTGRTIAIVCAVVLALILFVPLPIQSTSSSACVSDPTSSGECDDSTVVGISFENLFQLLVRRLSTSAR